MIKDYIRTLSDETLVQCIRDYDAFVEKGYLDDPSELRRYVNNMMEKQSYCNPSNFLMYVQEFMFEVFHHFAILYLEK